MPDPDLWGRLPEGVGQEAFFQVGRSAPEWEPLQKLSKAEGTDRFVVSRPALCRHTPWQGMTV
jgi:hypothetical protein